VFIPVFTTSVTIAQALPELPSKTECHVFNGSRCICEHWRI